MSLFNIIGKDCEDIIMDYKYEMELYDKQKKINSEIEVLECGQDMSSVDFYAYNYPSIFLSLLELNKKEDIYKYITESIMYNNRVKCGIYKYHYNDI
jgi:hypothetical protein